MNFNSPLVSVVMPVYNSATYLEQAIRSILNQTFTNFELIIFNDGSEDNSSDIIKAIKDERIRFFDDSQNTGYVIRLNEGLRIAHGKYIARMDSDDIAYPERLAKQVAFMEIHTTVGVCGTAFQTFGSRNISANMPVEDSAIREFMLVHNPIGHPTVMMRKSVIDEYDLKYEQDYTPAEDYRMWYDFSKVSSLRNLPDILLDYRTHDNQISNSMNTIQRANVNKVRWLQLQDKGFRLSDTEVVLYCNLLDYNFIPNNAYNLLAVLRLIKSILSQNKKLNAMPAAWLEKLFVNRWKFSIHQIKRFTPSYIIPLVVLQIPVRDTFTLKNKINFILKSLLFRNY